ncbi:hypothetical protein E2562_022550, partial [Oryza meyeriana var. granulata]
MAPIAPAFSRLPPTVVRADEAVTVGAGATGGSGVLRGGHKVCEAYCKTPIVTFAGQQQRFCQQCSSYIQSIMRMHLN